jgi:hypothetical protein
MSCSKCIWWSDGVQDPRGVGWCYSEEDYTDPEYYCPFFQESLRTEPVNPAPLVNQPKWEHGSHHQKR